VVELPVALHATIRAAGCATSVLQRRRFWWQHNQYRHLDEHDRAPHPLTVQPRVFATTTGFVESSDERQICPFLS
jgi:hypothetical protein